jgi:hypothetical protein
MLTLGCHERGVPTNLFVREHGDGSFERGWRKRSGSSADVVCLGSRVGWDDENGVPVPPRKTCAASLASPSPVRYWLWYHSPHPRSHLRFIHNTVPSSAPPVALPALPAVSSAPAFLPFRSPLIRRDTICSTAVTAPGLALAIHLPVSPWHCPHSHSVRASITIKFSCRN